MTNSWFLQKLKQNCLLVEDISNERELCIASSYMKGILTLSLHPVVACYGQLWPVVASCRQSRLHWRKTT